MSTHAVPEKFLKALKTDFRQDFFTTEPSELEIFGKDWTKVYPPAPSAVVFPKTTDEVVKIVKLCTLHKVALVPSGGRTGLAGGAVAAHGEVVLSFSKMNRMDEVDTLALTVRVQAGAVTEAVHHHCAPHGLTWPVDFSSKGSSHVGGNIATNAGGVKVIHYGLTRNWVLGLQVVTMNGEILELNGALEKNNTGLDLRQLFIGTEGTLGIITEATLKLTKLPRDLDVFFFSVKDIAGVLQLFHEARRGPFNIMAFETLTQNCLDTVTKHMKIKSPLQNPGGAYVLLEIERPHVESAQKILDQWLEQIFEKGFVLDGTLAQSPKEAKEIWKIRELVAESLFIEGYVHKNDISVPIVELVEFCAGLYKLFKNRPEPLEVYLFGHIGDGNLHINTMKPEKMSKEAFLKVAHETDKELFALTKRHKGSISAEHGIGLLKKADLSFSRTPSEINLFKAFKKTLDPNGLLNPGKIFDL
jgi:glycolate oxidase subunit GlcD